MTWRLRVAWRPLEALALPTGWGLAGPAGPAAKEQQTAVGGGWTLQL